MRVFYINSMCGLGSTGRIVADLCSIVLKNEGDVRIAFGLGDSRDVDTNKTVKINNRTGYYIHNILAKITDKTGLYSSFQTKKLVETIEAFKPDIIHLHNLHGYYINYKVLFEYLRKAKIPVVWTLHDCWAFTGHCAHFDYIECERWKTLCSDCPQLYAYPKCYFCGREKKNYLLKKELFNSVEKLQIITPSKWLKEKVDQSFLNSKSVQVINNGIDLNVFKPQKSYFRENNSLENNKIILSVANDWGDKKGLKDFYKLSELVDDEYKIVLVGLEEKKLKDLPQGIIGIQRTNSPEELAEIYSAADVFVNLTYEDTFPTVNIEALACGLPIVTYATGGSSEIIDNISGITIPKGDLNAVPNAIRNALLLKKENCRKRAEAFDKTKKYKEYYALYESLL